MTLPSLIDDTDLARLEDAARSAPPGDFLEVGVYKGGSAQLLYRIAEEQGRCLVLVDTFQGHVAVTEHDHKAHPVGRFSDGITPEELRAALPHATIVVGPFERAVWDLPLERFFAFAHIDCDLYTPIRAACESLPHFMVPGGVLVFDDYGHTDCPGATRAVDEVFGPPEIKDQVWRMVRLPGG